MDAGRLRQEARVWIDGQVTATPGAACVRGLAVGLLLAAGCVRRQALPPLPLPTVAQASASQPHVEPELITVRHKVKPGQTLYRIARAYGIRAAELMEINGIEDPRTLVTGQELLIPGAAEPRDVAPTEPSAMIPPPPVKGSIDDPVEGGGDEPPAPKRTPPKVSRVKVVMTPPPNRDRRTSPPGPPPRDEGKKLNEEPPGAETPSRPPRATAEEPSRSKAPEVATRPPVNPSGAPPPGREAKPGTKGNGREVQLQWPLRGVLYARFGKKGREAHDGIDLAAPVGTPVTTAGEGTVLFAGEQQGYGRIALIEHEHGFITLYAHNRDLRVKTGQKVRQGQVIATVGESGKTSGPHLHFEVRQEGLPVDPLEYLGPVPPR